MQQDTDESSLDLKDVERASNLGQSSLKNPGMEEGKVVMGLKTRTGRVG